MNIAKNTAKRMLAAIEQQLQGLAQEQQSMNGNRGGSAQYRCGGKIKRHKMQTQGLVPGGPDWMQGGMPQGNGLDRLNWDNSFEFPMANNPYEPQYANTSTKKPWQMVPDAPVGSRVAVPDNKIPFAQGQTVNPAFGMSGYQAPPGGDLGIPAYNPAPSNMAKQYNFSNPLDNPTSLSFDPAQSRKDSQAGMKRPGNSGSAMDWMGMLPSIFNLGAGLLQPKAQHLNANQFQNPYEGQALAQMPSQYRIDPLLNEYKNAYANTVRNVNNMGNSRGERMANYGAAQNQYGQQVGGAYADKFNQENQMATRKAMMMNEQGQQRARVNMGVQNMNDQNTAAAQNNRMGYLGAAASGAQRYSLVNRQMANQESSQDAYMRALFNSGQFMPDWLDPAGLMSKYRTKGKK
jgi:hypothetical protein